MVVLLYTYLVCCFFSGGFIILTTRAMLLDTPNYQSLEPLMARLESEGKWKKVARDIVGKLYSDFDAIVWKYQVC